MLGKPAIHTLHMSDWRKVCYAVIHQGNSCQFSQTGQGTEITNQVVAQVKINQLNKMNKRFDIFNPVVIQRQTFQAGNFTQRPDVAYLVRIQVEST